MIYLDNSATTYPKPQPVINALSYAVRELGANPGRSGHSMSVKAAKAVFEVREKAAAFFGAKPENVIFTSNCTHSLNTAIKGILKKGDHVITSSLEHNSVARPIFALQSEGVEVSVAPVYESDEQTKEAFERLIKKNTKAIVCTHASNVTGKLLPISSIARICREHGIAFIVDAAQTAGVIDVKLTDGVNVICTAGHKGLFGPMGTGLLITDGKFPIKPLTEGGTGNASLELSQPSELPEALESGTVNTPGIYALGKGLDFVSSLGTEKIYKHESKLCNILVSELEAIPEITLLRGEGSYAPIVSFNVNGVHSSEVAQYLSQKGVASRGGFHCAALTHGYLKTSDVGAVRLSPGVFTTERQIFTAAQMIKKFVKSQNTPL